MESYTLENHKSKCRCCVKTLNKRHKFMTISEDIQDKFYAITEINLKNSLIYSDKICTSCDKELKSFQRFKQDLIERQLKLYDFCNVEDNKDPINLNVKLEDPELPSVAEINIKEEFEAEDNNYAVYSESDNKNSVKELIQTEKRSKKLIGAEQTDSNSFQLTEISKNPPKRKCGRKKIDYPNGVKPKRKQKLTYSVLERLKVKYCKDCKRNVKDISRHWKRCHSNVSFKAIIETVTYDFLLTDQKLRLRSVRLFLLLKTWIEESSEDKTLGQREERNI